MTDLIATLDALGEKANARTTTEATQLSADRWAFLIALHNAWPTLRDRLRAAEAVCEAAQYLPSSHELMDALEAWRAATQAKQGDKG